MQGSNLQIHGLILSMSQYKSEPIVAWRSFCSPLFTKPPLRFLRADVWHQNHRPVPKEYQCPSENREYL